jgi:hypothetical protein
MTPALVGLAIQMVMLGAVVAIQPWRHLHTEEMVGGFPVGPAMYMGMFALVGMVVVVVVQLLHLLTGWPGLTYSDWEGLL